MTLTVHWRHLIVIHLLRGPASLNSLYVKIYFNIDDAHATIEMLYFVPYDRAMLDARSLR